MLEKEIITYHLCKLKKKYFKFSSYLSIDLFSHFRMSKKEVPETKSKLEQLNQIEHKIADAIKNAGENIIPHVTTSNRNF